MLYFGTTNWLISLFETEFNKTRNFVVIPCALKLLADTALHVTFIFLLGNPHGCQCHLI